MNAAVPSWVRGARIGGGLTGLPSSRSMPVTRIGLHHSTGADMNDSPSLSNLLKEERRFAPPAELAANANVTATAYEQAGADRLDFWAGQARRLSWGTEPTETLDWSNPPFAKWFND